MSFWVVTYWDYMVLMAGGQPSGLELMRGLELIGGGRLAAGEESQWIVPVGWVHN